MLQAGPLANAQGWQEGSCAHKCQQGTSGKTTRRAEANHGVPRPRRNDRTRADAHFGSCLAKRGWRQETSIGALSGRVPDAASIEHRGLDVASRPPGKRPGVAGGFLRPQAPTMLKDAGNDSHPRAAHGGRLRETHIGGLSVRPSDVPKPAPTARRHTSQAGPLANAQGWQEGSCAHKCQQ